MNEFLNYLVQTSVILAFFYVIYFLFLQNEKFYVEIRAYLVLSLMLTVILPFVKIPYTIIEKVEGVKKQGIELFQEPTVTNLIGTQENGGINFYQVLLGFYLLVVFVLLIRSIIRILKIRRILKNQEIVREENTKLVILDQETPAFTFFEYVIISRTEFNDESLKNILIHEKVHANQKHWIDLVMIEALCILLWFNPFVWLFQLAIKQTHELLADDGVLARGFSIGQYQAQLINQLMGEEVIGLANNFNFSINKKRMIMMTKEKSNRNQRYKLLLMLPVVVATILFNLQITKQAVASESNSIAVSEDVVKISGKVLAADGKPISGAAVMEKSSKNGITTNINGEFSMEVDRKATLRVMFIGMKAKDIPVKRFLKKAKGDLLIITLKEGNGTISEFTQKPAKSVMDDNVFVIVEKMPKFPGGQRKLDAKRHYATAKIAQQFKDVSRCFISFIISNTGKIEKVKVTRTSGNEKADKAAMDFIKSLPDWEPGMHKGKRVNVSYTVPFEFKEAR